LDGVGQCDCESFILSRQGHEPRLCCTHNDKEHLGEGFVAKHSDYFIGCACGVKVAKDEVSKGDAEIVAGGL